MASFNRVILLGNLTRDIDLRFTKGGTPVATIGLAVNERRKQGDDWVDEVMFVDCTTFGKTAENAAEYLSKGSPVFVEGRLKLESWEKDGQKHSKHTVMVDKLQFLSRGTGAAAKHETVAAVATEDDDLPF